ncbi:MAG: aminotransferase class I/II-fold pyridoxal phosphate-dependent enzyme, partial [Methanoregula sp.]|nr:aminotransferase class I/II-fold pyridoxal phosphate-dependent enzyme [Methanoregula sp.]
VAYKNQSECMLRVMTETFPDSVTWTRPHGGMFIWITLPDGCSSQDVFEAALQEQVAVLPGTPFYVDGGGKSTMRLNFSNSTDDKIITGIQRLARVIKKECGR